MAVGVGGYRGDYLSLSNILMEHRTITSQDEAVEYAKEWQEWANEESLSYGELAEWGAEFRALAEVWDLVEEFEENGII